MAPPKTTGTGKPAITLAEKAAKYNITIPEYKERSKIGNEMKSYVNSRLKERLKKNPDDRKKVFLELWKESRDNIKSKYDIGLLKKLQVNYDGSKTEKKAPKKKKSKTVAKKPAVKKGAVKVAEKPKTKIRNKPARGS